MFTAKCCQPVHTSTFYERKGTEEDKRNEHDVFHPIFFTWISLTPLFPFAVENGPPRYSRRNRVGLGRRWSWRAFLPWRRNRRYVTLKRNLVWWTERRITHFWPRRSHTLKKYQSWCVCTTRCLRLSRRDRDSEGLFLVTGYCLLFCTAFRWFGSRRWDAKCCRWDWLRNC